MKRTIDWECMECEAAGEVPLILGPNEGDDRFDAPSVCPKCGEETIRVFGVSSREPGREDFHADG